MNKRKKSFIIISGVFLLIGVLAVMSAIWYINMYGNVGFSAIVFTLTTDNGSVEEGIINSYLLKALVPTVFIYTALIVPFIKRTRMVNIFSSAYTDSAFAKADAT